jgi:hypothetical protein
MAEGVKRREPEPEHGPEHEYERERSQGELRHLSQELRLAIETALAGGLTATAVALDTARNGVDSVIEDPAPRSTRVALARARGRLALEAWRNLRH